MWKSLTMDNFCRFRHLKKVTAITINKLEPVIEDLASQRKAYNPIDPDEKVVFIESEA